MSTQGKIPFVAPIRPVNLIWIAIVGGVVWAASHYGTPHLRIQYVWSGRSAQPVYHDCFYWGLHPFRLRPSSGECPLVVLSRPGQEPR